MEETLARSNLDIAKASLRGLHNFKMALSRVRIFGKFLAIPLSVC